MPTADTPPRPASPVDPPTRDHGDACPGALRLHAADDGALARIRLPAGALTAARAHTLADAAERLGDGALHLTSRGNVQLRGLADDCGTELAQLLGAAGMLPSPAHERVRNIVASPLSGLDGRGYADVTPWAHELDRLLCARAVAAGLSGRFLFAFDDGRGDVASLGADVTVVAGAEPPDPVAAVYVGGVAAVAVPGAEAPRAALLAAELFLATAQEYGTSPWRIDELPDGATPVSDALARRLADCGAAPAGAQPVDNTDDRPHPLQPGSRPALHGARGFAPGSGRGGAADGDGAEPGIVNGPDGPNGHTAALSVAAPLGTLTASRWRLLAAVAETDGTGELRLTPWRGVIVPGLRPDTARARLAALAEAGLITSPDSPWYGVGACAGRPGCAKSLADVRADARDAVQHGPRTGTGLPVYWSGCARRCGRPRGAHVDICATDDGYDVSVPGGSVPGESET